MDAWRAGGGGEVTSGDDDSGGEVAAPSLPAAQSPVTSIPRGHFPEQHTRTPAAVAASRLLSPACEDIFKPTRFISCLSSHT